VEQLMAEIRKALELTRAGVAQASSL
jgi:hypothetical protein